MESKSNETRILAARKIWKAWSSFLAIVEKENVEYLAARKKQEEQEREKRNDYFWSDGSCKNHDREGCRECQWFINGCPDYSERCYFAY